jgi:flagellar biosynthesis/type III secretory pathway M-ring protein FliF/YscJ
VSTLLAEAPALPLGEAGGYVAAAYLVFLVLLVVYVAIMAAKVQRIERELRELASFAEARNSSEEAAPGRESEARSISDSLAPHGSRGGGAL